MSERYSGPSHDEDWSADIIPMRRRGEVLEPDQLSDSEVVDFYGSIWRHPSMARRDAANMILEDSLAQSGDQDAPDDWQRRLSQVNHGSPLLDHYDELFEADPVIRMLDTMMRTTLDQHRELQQERRAASVLMSLRAAQVIDELTADQRISHGDEDDWMELIKRLFGPNLSQP